MIAIKKEELNSLSVCLEEFKRDYEPLNKSYMTDLWNIIISNNTDLRFTVQYKGIDIAYCYNKSNYKEITDIYTDLCLVVETKEISIANMQDLMKVLINVYRYDVNNRFVGNKVAVIHGDILKCIL